MNAESRLQELVDYRETMSKQVYLVNAVNEIMSELWIMTNRDYVPIMEQAESALAIVSVCEHIRLTMCQDNTDLFETDFENGKKHVLEFYDWALNKQDRYVKQAAELKNAGKL